MGSVGAGLASVGGSIAAAEELQRKEKMEQAKLALEQGYLGVQQRYAGIAGEREGLERQKFEEQQRLAKMPKFVGFRSVGGRLYYGVQDPTSGKVSIQEVSGVDAAQDAQALEQSIEALPVEAQDAARAAIVPYLQIGDYQGARGALKPVSQKYAESLLPGQTTITDTTETHQIETPQGPKVVRFPKRTEQRKVPAAKITGTPATVAPPKVAGAAAPISKTIPKPLTPPAPKSPRQIAKDLGLPHGAEVLGGKVRTSAEITKLITPPSDADKRYKVMLDAAAHPSPQNDVAMLFNHIGMTLSAQRGARITTAEIQRAITARELAGDLQAMWQKVTNGQFLTPQQRTQMLHLGKLNREFIWQQTWENAKAEKMANYLPKTLPGLPLVPGIHFVGEDIQLKQGGRARVTEIYPNGTYEAKPY